MRFTVPGRCAAPLFSLLVLAFHGLAQGANTAAAPTVQQIQTALDSSRAGDPSTAAEPMRVTDLRMCQPSPTIAGEMLCLIGTSTSKRDTYMVQALQQKKQGDANVWVATGRKNDEFPPPKPAEAQAVMRAWAEEQVANNPQAAANPEVQAARTTLRVTSTGECILHGKTGHLACLATIAKPGQPDEETAMTFAIEGGRWRGARQ
ncbi:MAG: hypothetical protein ABW202_02945 [Duganella sp.]